ncbi:DoxX family protein [Salininema proteolyticum]|uniref:DoxX family protein n=1 Tax=Salininema proteolyticum TaxID=1607685 RepID=A0ABV8U4H7_9ACTN
MRPRRILYWGTTLVIALESAVGGVWDVLRTDYVREVLEVELGYPYYVAILLGVWKIPGAVVLLLPGLPRLKEWAYAGVMLVYTGAFASHLLAGDAAAGFGPLGFAAITALSWYLRPEARAYSVADPLARSRPATVAYWGSTAVLGTVLLAGGVADLLRRPDTLAGMEALGYPAYFLLIIGFWKVVGAAALVAPLPRRIVEWAYAGAFFNFSGAAVSHVVSGSAVSHVLWTAFFSLTVLASYALWSRDRFRKPRPLAGHRPMGYSALCNTAICTITEEGSWRDADRDRTWWRSPCWHS